MPSALVDSAAPPPTLLILLIRRVGAFYIRQIYVNATYFGLRLLLV